MTPVAEARRTVRAARRRLTGAALLVHAARGLLWGSLAGCAVAVGAAALGIAPPVAVLAPALGLGLAGAVRVLLAPPSEARAAFALDRAAGTDEAFLSALTADDAEPSFRDLCAAYALERCDRARVVAALPLEPPRAATGAAVAFALLTALVLVPRASAGEAPPPPGAAPAVPEPGVPGEVGPVSPADRARALGEAIAAQPEEADRLAAGVRRTVPALGEDDLRDLAKALGEHPDARRREAAERALQALDAGDREAAAAALREALGAEGALPAAAPNGTGSVAARGPVEAGAPGPWSAPTWPLRYDRKVRRWLELRAAQAGPGGNR